jgi:hypothetical protein
MLVEERVFQIDRDETGVNRSNPVVTATAEILTQPDNVREAFEWGVILNKPDAVQATRDFLGHMSEINEAAEREIAVREARNEFHSNPQIMPTTRVEQLTDMTSELSMGRNLELVRFNLQEAA